jgi:chaperonin GroEL (HSP60 family)
VLTGVKILRKALPEPMATLAENAGYDGAVIVENVRRGAEGTEQCPHTVST